MLCTVSWISWTCREAPTRRFAAASGPRCEETQHHPSTCRCYDPCDGACCWPCIKSLASLTLRSETCWLRAVVMTQGLVHRDTQGCVVDSKCYSVDAVLLYSAGSQSQESARVLGEAVCDVAEGPGSSGVPSQHAIDALGLVSYGVHCIIYA
jgi:hypothetical protein